MLQVYFSIAALESHQLQKYSDDSSVVGCIRLGQDAEYRELVEGFLARCENNHLILNVSKAKEMVVDFKRSKIRSKTISFMEEEVEVTEEYKYFGVHSDIRLGWSCNGKTVHEKGPSRLRQLRFVKVCRKMLQLFYKSVVEGVICHHLSGWQHQNQGLKT